MSPDQTTFHSALLDPAQAVPEGLSDGAARPAGRRFNVYRNNVASSLTDVLHAGFPTVAKLIGEENMDGLAGLFLRAHPPETPMILEWGAALPDFIATLPQLQHLGYLPDVARLDYALRRAYHAGDADPVDPGRLGALAADPGHGVFVAEAVSVILQVGSFKLTGKRIFKMAPLHHHFELMGWKETKVITRFWIVSIICALVGVATLKLR